MITNNQKKSLEFTDLIVWKEGHSLVVQIYKATKLFPRDEIHGLIDQMRRCAVSITSNISEGFGRQQYADKIHFYIIARGSLSELKNQLLIARDVKYIPPTLFEILIGQAEKVHILLNSLVKTSRTHLKG